ncbi:amidase [Rhizobium sp.]|uniref:amidase n=1 Tax=Rhizobium sp. TaxID=391 RepID=UPI0034C5D250
MAILSEIDTLAKASLALERGEISAVELTQACLDRCEALEPKLSSFLALEPEKALDMARLADAGRRSGGTVSAIAGIPLAVKDIIDVEGMRSTGHSRLYAQRLASRDAEVVARLRAQGAVILGKVTTNEFAIGAHDGDALAPNARNPWNVDHTPGGSSSGSGVSVASGEVFGALGTDTGGSIRVPAAFNGIVGLKPSRGLVSIRGVMPLSESMDNVGPMARTVEDVAILLDAMTFQVNQGAAETVRAPETFHARANAIPQNASYVRVRDFDHLLPEAHLTALDKAEDVLEGCGVRRKRSLFKDLEELDAISAVIATAESWSYHRIRIARYPELYGRDARIKLHIGALISGDDYLLAKRRQAELVHSFETEMGASDFLLLPTTIGPAPKLSKTGGMVNFQRWMHAGPNGFANALGGPALAIPCGLDAGLPLSLQIVGPNGSDAQVLGLGQHLANAFAHSHVMPVSF